MNEFETGVCVGYLLHKGDSSIILDTFTTAANGHWSAQAGHAWNDITVNVPQSAAVIQSLTATENRTYTAPQGVDGYNPVTVNVPQPTLTTLNASENRTYTAPANTAYNVVNVNVPTYEEEYEEMVECSQAVIAALQAYDPDFDPQGCEDIVPEVEKIGDENAAVTPMLDKTSYPDMSTADLPDTQGVIQVGGLMFTFYKRVLTDGPGRVVIDCYVTSKGQTIDGYITGGEMWQRLDSIGLLLEYQYSNFVVGFSTGLWELVLQFDWSCTGTGTDSGTRTVCWSAPDGYNSWWEYLGYSSAQDAATDINSAGVNVSTVK